MKSIQRRIRVIIVQAKRCLKSLVWGLSDHSSRIAPQSKLGQFWVMKYLPAQFSLKPLDMHKCLFYGKSTGFLPGDCQKNFIGLGPFKHIENAFCITIEAKLLHKLWLGRDPRGMIVQTLELAYLTPLGMHYNQTHPPLNPFYLMRPNVGASICKFVCWSVRNSQWIFFPLCWSCLGAWRVTCR